MNKIVTQLKSTSVAVELMSAYRSLYEEAGKELSKIDLELVMSMLRYQTKYPEKTPWVRLEIIFHPSVDQTVKKDELFEKTGSSADIRDGNIFIVDHFVTLQNLEELARDEEIEYIKGEVMPSRRY
ncbi:MAG: hypothetical protein ACE5J2_07395 [Nitrososphaerales archaeon]